MSRLLLILLLATLLSLPAWTDWSVWSVSTTQRVVRGDPPGTGVAVQLYAARNEWRSFQVLLRSDTPLSDIDVVPGDLQGPDHCVLPAAAAQLYREHQFHMGGASWHNPDFHVDWFPDALIPFKHPLTGAPLVGARFQAVPFDLPANETHGFWIDIFVPADARPGSYHGSYLVKAAGKAAVTVPVTLTVWNFTLPDTPTLQTALCEGASPVDDLQEYSFKRAKEHEEPAPTDWKAITEQCHAMLQQHHINIRVGISLSPKEQPDGTFLIPDAQIAALRAYIDRCHINAYEVPNPTSIVKDPDIERMRLNAWLQSWDVAVEKLQRPQVLFYTYLADEPDGEAAYHFVQKWGRAIREAHTAVKVMVTIQSPPLHAEWGDLYGAVDIWCPMFWHFDPQDAAARQAKGETFWVYTLMTAGDAPTPWWQTDLPLLNYRATAWIAWRYHIQGLLYWRMSYWQRMKDPWMEARTFSWYHGEGVLVYPARDVGYEGIAPSMRLKALRDGIQDYEYLAILARAGQADAAEKIVQPLAESWYQWEKDPTAYDKARIALAALIVKTQP